jgi:hypothetical protein
MGFVRIMSSGGGRLARVAAGLALFVVGLAVGGGWLALSVVGLLPLVAGAANVCLLAPLVGQPVRRR